MVETLRVVRDLAVRAGASWIHLEEEAVPMIEERIEHNRDTVIEIEIRVARQLRRNDVARRSIAAEDTDVQGAFGVDHPDVGVLRRGTALDGFALHASAER